MLSYFWIRFGFPVSDWFPKLDIGYSCGLAEAGATTPQIAAISVHSIDYCQRIIDTYTSRRKD